MKKTTTEDIQHIYGIDSWGKKYFSVNEQGHLLIHPTANTEQQIDIFDTVIQAQAQKVGAPMVLRFPQMLARRVNRLVEAFEKSQKEFSYNGKYMPVFPIKVNQNKSVVQGLLKAGQQHNLGIEVGSKPELMVALGQDVAEQALTICNGFKDQAYFDLASMGVSLGRNMITVIEKPFELKYVQTLAQEGKPIPNLGFRIKLQAKGSGLWEKSGGHSSKFGLSTMQLIASIEWLKEKNLLSHLKLLHFHIGSQITEIRKIKAAIREAARVYAKVKKMGVDIQYLDVGGGLGVDYDGSKTSSDASVNYSIGEYANDVVYTIAEVCESEDVPHPTIVSESGRALTTHHSMLIMDVRDVIREAAMDQEPVIESNEHQVIDDLLYIYRNYTVKNYREYYHDAVEKRDEMQSLFNLGMLDIEDRAKGEWLYWKVAQMAVKFSKTAKFVTDEFVELEQKLFQKVVCNFSVFQSIPDHWALDQLFPIVPIHRLNEMPTLKATIVDITCDSDGEVDKFVDLKDIKDALELHELKEGQPYYIGILMIGSYQDTMGDMHNLFGSVNNVHVSLNEDGQTTIDSVVRGDTNKDTIEMFGYDQEALMKHAQQTLKKNKEPKADQLLEMYHGLFQDYTYLRD